MSVALVTMDSAYGLRLGIGSHHHHHHHHHHRVRSPESHVVPRQEQPQDRKEDIETPLRFSVVNILRPDFGREAILSTKAPKQTSLVTGHSTTIPVPIPRHSPLSLPRDLSLSSNRLSPTRPQPSGFSVHRERELFSTHCGLTSPLQRNSGLSRSGSLESLASNRSSVTGSSVTGAPSLGSASSTIGTDSLSGDSNSGSVSNSTTSQSAINGQSPWPAWVYCTRYSDRPSSGRYFNPSAVQLPCAHEKEIITPIYGNRLADVRMNSQPCTGELNHADRYILVNRVIKEVELREQVAIARDSRTTISPYPLNQLTLATVTSGNQFLCKSTARRYRKIVRPHKAHPITAAEYLRSAIRFHKETTSFP